MQMAVGLAALLARHTMALLIFDSDNLRVRLG